MNFDFEQLTKGLSLVTAVAVIGAIAFTAGYLNYFGYVWVTSLSLTDVFALTWSILPITALCLAGIVGLTPHDVLPRLMGRDGPATSPIRIPGTPRQVWARRALPMAVVASALVVVILAGRTPWNTWIPAGGIVLVEISIGLAFIAEKDPALRRRRWFPTLGVMALSLCYLLGLSLGAKSKLEHPKDVIELKSDGIVTAARLRGEHPGANDFARGPNDFAGRCVSIIYVGERGFLIHNRTKDETTFVPRDVVANFAKRRSACGKRPTSYAWPFGLIWRSTP